VADLVELCFRDNLDEDGRLYIEQMRQSARSGRLLNMAAAASRYADLPTGGFVWEESGRLIGNLTLIPVHSGSGRRTLIANVAVHPDFRRHGIARALTQAALDEIRSRGVEETWLQVDENNQSAQELYRSFKFAERARYTTWAAKPQRESAAAHTNAVKVHGSRPSEWPAQRRWLAEAYPASLRWNLALRLALFEPGLRGGWRRLMDTRQTERWSAFYDGKLSAGLLWNSSSLNADRLWLGAALEHEDQTIPALIAHARQSLPAWRPLLLDYPAARGRVGLQAAGLASVRTLIWMRLEK
jgi:ribosomal protein S18 acetylase RimI-like enzyme